MTFKHPYLPLKIASQIHEGLKHSKWASNTIVSPATKSLMILATVQISIFFQKFQRSIAKKTCES